MTRSILSKAEKGDELVPAFTWRELEQRLEAMAASPSKRAMVPAMVAGIRKTAWSTSTENTLDRILALSWIMNDDTYQPALTSQPLD